MDIETARNKLAQQASDMCEKGGMTPMEVANLYLEAGTAVALSCVSPEHVAQEFRARADAIENLDGPSLDS